MIDETTANRALAPLWVLFPKSEEEWEYQVMITRALMKVARDLTHAVEIVEQLCNRSKFRPLPAEVLEAAAALQPVDEALPGEYKGLDPDCPLCSDNGWTITRRGAVRCHRCYPELSNAGGVH